jgi:putative endonuclease
MEAQIAAGAGRAPDAVLHRASYEMSEARIALGKSGEDVACRELTRRGYAIVARRVRLRRGELDIVARDGPVLVFVEVKTRAGRRFGEAAEAVTSTKRRRIARLAREYLLRHRLSDCPCRFDVVSVNVGGEAGGEAPAVEVIQNAFDA